MYSFDSKVRYSECDEKGNLSLVSLVNYLQDCSTFHSEAICRGLSYMEEHHYAWFISAWQIKIDRLPRFCDDIRVSTWCYDLKRAQAMRNFTIALADGTPCVKADSLWFVFDTEAQRPMRVPEDQMVYLTDDAPLDLPPTQRKIALEGEGIAMPSIVVSEQHLDTNRHVNNAQYIQMAVDALYTFVNDTEEHVPGSIAVQYKTMALLGDAIVPNVHVIDGGAIVDLASPEGDSYAIVKLEEKSAQ